MGIYNLGKFAKLPVFYKFKEDVRPKLPILSVPESIAGGVREGDGDRLAADVISQVPRGPADRPI